MDGGSGKDYVATVVASCQVRRGQSGKQRTRASEATTPAACVQRSFLGACPASDQVPRGKAEKYFLRDGSCHGCPIKYCCIRLFTTALP